MRNKNDYKNYSNTSSSKASKVKQMLSKLILFELALKIQTHTQSNSTHVYEIVRKHGAKECFSSLIFFSKKKQKNDFASRNLHSIIFQY